MHELPGDSYESFDVCQVSPQKAKSNLLILLAVPRNYFYCWPSQGGSSVLVLLVILDVARCYLWLFHVIYNYKNR